MTTTSPALHTLTERGLLYRCQEQSALDTALAAGLIAVVMRIDGEPHLGHLAPLMVLRWMQADGHKPVVLLGSPAIEAANGVPRPSTEHLTRVLGHLLRFGEGESDAVLLDTAHWRDGLREMTPWTAAIGRNASRSPEIAHQPGAPDGGVSEALDALEVLRRYGGILRVGALDQEDRIGKGLTLARDLGGDRLFGLTTVLPATAPGLRLGTVPGPQISLDPERLSPAAFLRLWLDADIDDVPRFMRLFTDLSLAEIGRLTPRLRSHGDEARRVLAGAVTRLLHGSSASAETRRVA